MRVSVCFVQWWRFFDLICKVIMSIISLKMIEFVGVDGKLSANE